MKTTVSLIVLASCATSLHGATILFNDTVQQGSLFADSATNSSTTIDPTTEFPAPGGTDSIKFSPLNSSTFRSGGLAFFGGDKFTVPTGETLLKIAYMGEANGQVVRFTVQTDAGDLTYSNANTSDWTVNGSAGSTAALTSGAWHDVVLDLSAISGFTPGTTQLDGQISVTNSSGTASMFFGDIRLDSVPEPGTSALLGLAGLAFFARRRR